MSTKQRGKPKNARQLRRRGPQRSPYKKVLIVCEGEKTEPNYFLEVRSHYGLNTANVEVTGECGSDPVSVLRFAKDRFKRETAAGDPFDKVYCVFDKDTHTNYADALSSIAAAKPNGKFVAINSVPCFEYWLLLHFKFTTAPYSSSGRKSAGQSVLDELKAEMSDYEKGAGGVFDQLLDRLDDAKERAAKVLEIALKSDTDNPSTRVHVLVDFLQNIRPRD